MKKIKPKYVNSPSGYKGLLIIECPDCGKRKVINQKFRTSWYSCWNCGEDIPLEGMRKVYLNNCPYCGFHSKYLTNIPDDLFDIGCLNCHAPVDLEWNDKIGAFMALRD